jgi:hypothetical protein
MSPPSCPFSRLFEVAAEVALPSVENKVLSMFDNRTLPLAIYADFFTPLVPEEHYI